ncbi:glycoside hydrolase family 16 protein [Bellilinea sp.]
MKNSPETLFFDDFTAAHLNRDVWNVEVTGKIYNNEQQAYIDSPETVYISHSEADCNGALVLQAHYRPGFSTPQGAPFDFVSGRVHTRGKFTFRYGRVSARLKTPAVSGVWPAFWVLGNGGEWPACGEIDIMEAVGEPDWVSAAAHGPNYSGEAGLVNKKYFQPPDSIAEWHIYTAECTPEKLLFFVDDELIYRITRPMVTFFGPWVFNSEKFLILNLALGGTYPYKTNGIHQPYYGLPSPAVQEIQNNHVRFLVDWVKITTL